MHVPAEGLHRRLPEALRRRPQEYQARSVARKIEFFRTTSSANHSGLSTLSTIGWYLTEAVVLHSPWCGARQRIMTIKKSYPHESPGLASHYRSGSSRIPVAHEGNRNVSLIEGKEIDVAGGVEEWIERTMFTGQALATDMIGIIRSPKFSHRNEPAYRHNSQPGHSDDSAVLQKYTTPSSSQAKVCHGVATSNDITQLRHIIRYWLCFPTPIPPPPI